MIPLREGFFDGLDMLSAKEMKRKGNLTFMNKRQKMEIQLARINEREKKLQAAREKKEADLALLDDEEDDFKVKISLADYELLQQAKR